MCHGQLYQRRIERAFNKKFRPRVFEEGDLVLKKYNQAMPNHRGKFALISVIFTWFLLSSYLLKLLVFLYFFWFDLIFIYIYLFICALKEWEDFRLIYMGFTCKVGLSQLNQANLHPSRHEFKRRPTQLNSSPIGARNQLKFAPNPSPIRIRILACTSVSIFGITFGSDIQSRWFKLAGKLT